MMRTTLCAVLTGTLMLAAVPAVRANDNPDAKAAAKDVAQSLDTEAAAKKEAAAKASAKGEAGSSRWNDFLKNIPVGPGKLSIGGDIRTRWEYLDNYTIRGHGTGRDDDVLLLRKRVHFDYRIDKNIRAFLQFQDARFWLNELSVADFPGPCGYQNPVDVLQAFLEWKHIGGTPWGFKIGRQKIGYADKRIYGPGDWGNVGRWLWDAAKIYYHTDNVDVDLLFGQRVLYDSHHWDEKHHDYDMAGIYAQIKKLPIKLDLFYTLRYHDDDATVSEDAEGGPRRTHTLGFHVDGKFCKNWDYGGTVATQFGTWSEDDIRAIGIDAWLGHTWDVPWKPRLGAEFWYGSGDHDPNDGRHGTYDGMFGAVAPYYGWINIFSGENLQDYILTFSVNPCKRCKIWLDYHYFRLAASSDAWYYCSNRAVRRDATGGSGQSLGQEIDLMMKWNLTDDLEFQAGYAHFFPCSFINDTAGDNGPIDWAFIQFMYSF